MEAKKVRLVVGCLFLAFAVLIGISKVNGISNTASQAEYDAADAINRVDRIENRLDM